MKKSLLLCLASLAFPLPPRGFSPPLLLLHVPSVIVKIAFPSLHLGIETSGFPGFSRSPDTRLGLLQRLALWTELLLVSLLPLIRDNYSMDTLTSDAPSLDSWHLWCELVLPLCVHAYMHTHTDTQ